MDQEARGFLTVQNTGHGRVHVRVQGRAPVLRAERAHVARYVVDQGRCGDVVLQRDDGVPGAGLAMGLRADCDLIVCGRRCHAAGMYRDENDRLTDAELHAFFDRLFPHGFAGVDVLSEIAPEGWEQSPLLACFHPSVEQRYEESVQLHRNIESLLRARPRRDRDAVVDETPSPEPTLEQVRSEYQATPVKPDEEVTDLVGLCLWDVFSDNHDVIVADGRLVDIGSFRGAGAFLDEHLHRGQEDRWREGDYLRFYMGTIWISRRADLTPVYAMIFRRLRALGAEWEYHFPELYLWQMEPRDLGLERPAGYSVSESAAAEVKAQKRRAETARMRADIDQLNAQARERALDQETPATVRAYRQVYGRDPRGWPPA